MTTAYPVAAGQRVKVAVEPVDMSLAAGGTIGPDVTRCISPMGVAVLFMGDATERRVGVPAAGEFTILTDRNDRVQDGALITLRLQGKRRAAWPADSCGFWVASNSMWHGRH